jgi:hypothetical protein
MLTANIAAALAQRCHYLSPSISQQYAVHYAVTKKENDSGYDATDYHAANVYFPHVLLPLSASVFVCDY